MSRSSSITLVSDDDGFLPVASKYTFPTKYPPDFIPETDPFPCRFGDFSLFRKPTWERTPAMRSCLREEPSIDSLIEAFSRMEITLKSSSRQQPGCSRVFGESMLTAMSGCCTASPYTIHPLPAPLPSLIRNPSLHKNLEPCSLFRPSDHSFVIPIHKKVRNQHHATSLSASTSTSILKPQRAVVSVDETSASELKNKSISPSRPTKGTRKKPGLPKRVPTSRPTKSVPLIVHSEDMGPSNEALDHSSSNVTPSLSFSSSSCSSSETQSPTPSIHSLPEVSPLSSSTAEMGGINSLFNTSELLSEVSASAVSLPQFVSSDFTFDLFSKSPTDDVFNFSFHPLYAASLFQPALPIDIAAPTPLSFDFTSLAS